MSSYIKHISRLLCLVLALHIFVVSVHAQDNEEDENSFDITLVPTTVSTDHNDMPDHQPAQSHILPEHKHNKKYQSIKHISFKVVIPVAFRLPRYFAPKPCIKTPVLPKAYTYLYFQEINPPPPKAFLV